LINQALATARAFMDRVLTVVNILSLLTHEWC